MGRKKTSKFKVFVCGAVTGALVLVAGNYYSGKIMRKEDTNFKDQFSEPRFEESFNDTETVQRYSFDYYGEEIVIMGSSVRTFSLDEEGNVKIENGETVEIPARNRDYLLDEYISEKEAKVYKILRNKDTIKDQYSVYVVFSWMGQLYEEYLNRDPFASLENRKEAIYKNFHDYIISDEGYTMGGYKFNELPKTIQKDILEVYQNVNYMRKNDVVKEASKLSEFINRQEKVLKYGILKMGRD